MDYLKNKNLLNDLLYDENNADINDIPKISANIQSLLTRILDDQKYVQKYLIHIKELFSEIEYDKFETIDIVEELTKIKSKLTKSNLCLIFPMQLGVFKIFAHKVYFMEIIEQLIDNAETYAFPDKKKKGILKFDLENIGETLRMIYSNDGKKFTVYESDYITMGKTTIKGIGTGYGGAMIFKYITAFNGKLKIIPCESMKIEFSFPTNKSKEIYNGSRI